MILLAADISFLPNRYQDTSVMNKIYGVIIVHCAIAFFIFPGCSSNSMDEFPDKIVDTENNQEEVTVWVEEIRKEDEISVLGYLEKRRMIRDGVSGTRHAYVVYDSEFNDIYEGMIFDNGKTYVHANNGELSRVGIMTIEEGVKRILGYEKSVTFFREGRQTFHKSQ